MKQLSPSIKLGADNGTMKIAVAMSGGVDSSVAAKILKDEGHKVIGLFLKLWSDPLCNVARENRCCDYEALEDARKVAAMLEIPFYVVNARDEFKRQVVDYFLNEYKNLHTPNPCVVCNDKIKFGLLLNRAREIGCDYLATGHYARIGQSQISNLKSQTYNLKTKELKNLRTKRQKRFVYSRDSYISSSPRKLEARNYKLKAGIDKSKDQSYMLYHLSQDQLSRVLFPLGEMTKIEVRKLAKKWNLPVKEKPESQEICFFGDKDYRTFLKRYLPKKYFKPGEIVDRKGNVLGEHQGLVNYTIGQRKGVNQSQTSNLKPQNYTLKLKNYQDKIPLYVIGYDIENNQLIVGKDKEVYKKEMVVSDINWVDPKAISYKLKAKSLSVKIRYRHKAVSCKISNFKLQMSNKFQNCHCEESSTRQSDVRVILSDQRESKDLNNIAIQQFDNLLIIFDKPQRAITPGQSAVFYLGDEVLGGGIIR